MRAKSLNAPNPAIDPDCIPTIVLKIRSKDAIRNIGVKFGAANVFEASQGAIVNNIINIVRPDIIPKRFVRPIILPSSFRV